MKNHTTIEKTKAQKTAIFIGDKSSGKTSLIQVFLNQSGKKEIIPSAPLEFYHGKKTSIAAASKDVAHVYEIGGGKAFHELIKIPLGNEKIFNSVIIIVLDLSKLNSLLTSLKFWVFTVQEQIQYLLNDYKTKGINIEFNEETKDNWQKHEDISYIKSSKIPIVIAAHKYDKIISEDPYSSYLKNIYFLCQGKEKMVMQSSQIFLLEKLLFFSHDFHV